MARLDRLACDPAAAPERGMVLRLAQWPALARRTVCRACHFHSAHDCQITTLYWGWFRRHGAAVQPNPRMTTSVSAHAKRAASRHALQQRPADAIHAHFAAGGILTPQSQS